MKNTGQLEIWDKNFLWHPFTQMSSFLKETPLIIKGAKGVILKDIHGKEYIDGVSSLWCNIHGHRKKEIDRAIKTQLKQVAHATLLGASNIPSIILAKRLVEIAPKLLGPSAHTSPSPGGRGKGEGGGNTAPPEADSAPPSPPPSRGREFESSGAATQAAGISPTTGLTKVFYSDNGSTAVEVALKMAFQYWSALGGSGHPKKKKFIALQYAYHGDTLGAVAVGGIGQFHDIYRPLTFAGRSTAQIPNPPEENTTQIPPPSPSGKGEGVLFAPSPYCYRCPLGKEKESCHIACLEEMEKILAQNHNEIAGLIIEPLVQGAGGMIVHPRGYLRGIRELCSKYNVLLIADEVLTGFGRTGKMFACEHEGVVPDIMCISKGLTAGYLPLAATLVKEDIYNAFLGDQGRTFFHGHTYTGNPLACAAALASLEVFEKEGVLKDLQPKIEFLAKRLKDFCNLGHVGDIRQCGLIGGIELVKDRQSKEPYPPGDKIGQKVILEARNRGALLRPLGNVIVIMPPLSITLKQLERVMDIVYLSIEAVTVR